MGTINELLNRTREGDMGTITFIEKGLLNSRRFESLFFNNALGESKLFQSISLGARSIDFTFATETSKEEATTFIREFVKASHIKLEKMFNKYDNTFTACGKVLLPDDDEYYNITFRNYVPVTCELVERKRLVKAVPEHEEMYLEPVCGGDDDTANDDSANAGLADVTE
jgi:hypothetical protein